MSSGGGAAAYPDRGRYDDLEEDDEDRAEAAEMERLARIADEEADFQMMIQLNAKFDKRTARKAREAATVKAAAAPITATTVISTTNPAATSTDTRTTSSAAVTTQASPPVSETEDEEAVETAEEPAAKVFSRAGFGKRDHKVWFIPTHYVGEAAPDWVELDAEVTIQHAQHVGVENYKSLLLGNGISSDTEGAAAISDINTKYFGDSKVRGHNLVSI
jgi:hypothetical protein